MRIKQNTAQIPRGRLQAALPTYSLLNLSRWDCLMRIFVLLAMLGGCLLINTDNAFAQVGPRQTPGGGGGQVVSRVTPEQVAAALTQAGMRSQVVTQNNQKFVKMTIGEFKSPIVAFYDCNNQGCGNLEFVAFFNADAGFTADAMNQWNQQYRFAKVYVDTDGGAVFEMDMWLTGGVTMENIKENAKVFGALLTKFAEE